MLFQGILIKSASSLIHKIPVTGNMTGNQFYSLEGAARTIYLSNWFNTPTLWVGNNKFHLILRGSAPG